MSTGGERARRSVLAQSRSRETRSAIVRAALELWSERGYDEGFDQTTAEEIAARAGVARTTFYFHFARKDDLLAEAGWLTASVFYEEALNGLEAGIGVDDLIPLLLVRLARRIGKSSRPALRRMLRVQSEPIPDRPDEVEPVSDAEHFGFQRAFVVVFTTAQEHGQLPAAMSAHDLAGMLSSLVMDAIREWAWHDDVDLAAALLLAGSILLAGARHLEPTT